MLGSFYIAPIRGLAQQCRVEQEPQRLHFRRVWQGEGEKGPGTLH